MWSFSHAVPLLLTCLASGSDQPFWGCGMLGALPGIGKDGSVSSSTQKLIDALKVTNTKEGKVSYWNWDYAPMENSLPAKGHQYLTKDFLFMPENWGVTSAVPEYVRQAGQQNFLDSSGIRCPATMADIFLGANEPDIIGSCMGNLMGACTAPCTPGDVAAGDCPVASLSLPMGSGKPNSKGRCNCWQESHPTGVGFWPLTNASSVYQVLPVCWDHADCIAVVMQQWTHTAATAVKMGYKYLSAPLIAVNMSWTRNFVAKACDGCSDISCGCPTHIGWHFYANDCQPEQGGYQSFQKRLDDTVKLMEDFPHLQGAIVNEVGMLNCAMKTDDAICVPNSPNQKYPANKQTNHACPSTSSLPNGLATFVKELLKMTSKAKTSDGRLAVVSFTWFNLDMAGGTYNLQLFNNDGSLNELGNEYISSCQAWASSTQALPKTSGLVV